jgi:predicted permease
VELLELDALRLDGRVLGFTAALTVVAALLFGAAPAIGSARADLATALREGAGGSTRGHGSLRHLRGLLVAAEMAIALVLLAGAGLMLRSLERLHAIDTGVRAAGVLTLRVDPAEATHGYASGPEFKRQHMERIAALPGVQGVTVDQCAPLSGPCNRTGVFAVDDREYAPGEGPLLTVHSVGPDHFRVLGIPLRRGRGFTARDRVGAPRVVAINETAARRFWPGQDPIGRRIRIGQGGLQDSAATVIGVVGDVRYGAPEQDPIPAVYIAALQHGSPRTMVLIRAAADPVALAAAVRREVLALDSDLPIHDVRTLEDRMAAATSRTRFAALLLAVFAGVALLLAGVGIYGVIAYSVSQRTRELGVRMALGARRGDVVRLVVGQGAALAAAGIAIGLAAALALTRVLTGLLHGVTATDPATFAAISLLLAATAVAASLLPALRATRVDPLVALRSE